MNKDVLKLAETYNALRMNHVSAERLAVLCECWQENHDLAADGMLGPATIMSLDKFIRSMEDDFPEARCVPIRQLADGRRPVVTSRYWTNNPERAAPDKRHRGIDLFFHYDPKKDGVVKGGDGGRTGDWFIPDNTHAVAAADGRVMNAAYTGNSRTGYRTWIDHGTCFTGYFHLKNLTVLPGQFVTMGQPIGVISDNPADYDAKHLHFEVYVGDLSQYPKGSVDPEQFLSGAVIL